MVFLKNYKKVILNLDPYLLTQMVFLKNYKKVNFESGSIPFDTDGISKEF